MIRGFKKKAEEHAASWREHLHLRPVDRLPARSLLSALGAIVVNPIQIPGMTIEHLDHLAGKGADEWSALTIYTDNNPVVVLNDTHSEERQESNLHHEAAHLVLAHKPSAIVSLGSFALREFDESAEEEAQWLGGVLHLPRAALASALATRSGDIEIQKRYCASSELVRWRKSVTGVGRQFALRSTASRR